MPVEVRHLMRFLIFVAVSTAQRGADTRLRAGYVGRRTIEQVATRA